MPNDRILLNKFFWKGSKRFWRNHFFFWLHDDLFCEQLIQTLHLKVFFKERSYQRCLSNKLFCKIFVDQLFFWKGSKRCSTRISCFENMISYLWTSFFLKRIETFWTKSFFFWLHDDWFCELLIQNLHLKVFFKERSYQRCLSNKLFWKIC